MVEGFHDIQDTLDEAQSVIADLPTGDLEEFTNASQEIRDQTIQEARGHLHELREARQEDQPCAERRQGMQGDRDLKPFASSDPAARSSPSR